MWRRKMSKKEKPKTLAEAHDVIEALRQEIKELRSGQQQDKPAQEKPASGR
jgi:hypothetical protein